MAGWSAGWVGGLQSGWVVGVDGWVVCWVGGWSAEWVGGWGGWLGGLLGGWVVSWVGGRVVGWSVGWAKQRRQEERMEIMCKTHQEELEAFSSHIRRNSRRPSHAQHFIILQFQGAPLTLIWSNSCEWDSIASMSPSVMCGLNISLNTWSGTHTLE